VAVAVLAATFWLVVTTIRFVIHQDDLKREVARERARVEAIAAGRHGELVGPVPLNAAMATSDGDVFEGISDNALSKRALIAALNAARLGVHACYLRHQVEGTAMVNIVIANGGRVSSAKVTGKFQGTPSGDCVEAAVKAVRFPQSDGIPTRYPFILH